MGLILDLAVAALALAVIVSLGLLAWTLAVSVVRATRDGARRTAMARTRVTEAEARVQTAARRANAALGELRRRTQQYAGPGDEPDR